MIISGRHCEIKKLDYFFVLLLANLSGNPSLVIGPYQDGFLLFGGFVVVVRMFSHGRLHTRQFVIFAAAYLCVLVIQGILLDYFSLATIVGFLVKLTIGAGVVATVRYFRIVYTHVMVWLTLLSFVFHLPSILAGLAGIKLYEYFRVLSIETESYGQMERINIVVHNFLAGEMVSVYRNSGIFWEPGAFSGYLIVALLLLATVQNELPDDVLRRWRFVLVVGVLSTLSTTGYLLLPLALLSFRLAAIKGRVVLGRKILWVIGAFIVQVPLFYFGWSLEFIGPKVVELYERAVHQEAGWHLSRFGNVIFDWEYIRERPFFGWGQNITTQFALHPELQGVGVGNGLSGFIRQMGVIGFGIFILGLWRGLGRIVNNGLVKVLMIALVLLQLNGELFLLHPIYLGLMFIGLEKHSILHRRRMHKYTMKMKQSSAEQPIRLLSWRP